MAESIFTKIIKGQIPAHKVYEDDRVIAFLDIDPLTPGHTLVVPKQQIDHLWDTDEELYHHLLSVAKRVALRQRQVLSPPRVGMAVEGFAVAHTHIHVFPLNQGFESTVTAHIKRTESGEKPSPDELAAMAQKLAFSAD